MKRLLVALATLACAAFAQAHEYDPGGRIVVTCAADHAPRMSEIARAVEDSHYWAAQGARREMLDIARQECAEDATRRVVFVPEPDQRYGATGIVTVAQK
jgi:hypothetical protein